VLSRTLRTRHLHPRLVYLLDPRCCRILFQEYQGRNPVESDAKVTIVNSILAYGMAADLLALQ
jgi:hypothetical protein